MGIHLLPRTRAALAIAVCSILAAGCGTVSPTTASSPGLPPQTAAPDPTAVPDATAVPSSRPTPHPDAGLGCAGPVGTPDEIVLVGTDPARAPTLLVDAVAPDGSRRPIAEIDGLGPPNRTQVSPCGHLIVELDGVLTIVDLRSPDRRVELPDEITEDRDWGSDREGRVLVVDGSWDNLLQFDPRDGTRALVPRNGDVQTYPRAAWDGSGWYAEGPSTIDYGPPSRVGIADADGVFRRSAALAYSAFGFLWQTNADGAVAHERYGVGADDHQALDVHAPNGTTATWWETEPGHGIEQWAWDEAGHGIWLIDRAQSALRVLHLDGPGKPTEVAVIAPIGQDTSLSMVALASDAMLFTAPPDDERPRTLLRADLSSGHVSTLVEQLGDAVVAGWAAPPALPAGVMPPTPYGEPETAAGPDRPVAPDLPVDALAIVTCSASGTTLARPDVRALEDGVHFLVRHPDGTAASVEAAGVEAAGSETAVVGPIDGYSVASLPPGAYEIDCGGGPAPMHLRVLDPARLYRPAKLDCAGGGVVGESIGDPVPGPEAAAWLRPQLTLAPGDVVAPAGYPEAIGAPITVERGGRVVAVFKIERGTGGLLIFSREGCKGIDVGPNG